MKLLAGNGQTRGTARALKILAAGSALVVALWMMSDPPPPEAEELASAGTSRNGAPPASAAPGFAARKVAASVTNLFSGHSWFVPPPPPPPEVQVAPPPPSAPPLPFTVLGSYASAGGEPVYFLVKGDSVYDVRVGDVIDNTYSVDSMSNGQLQFTYLPLKIGQALPVGDAP
jgi:hypothetical protein